MLLQVKVLSHKDAAKAAEAHATLMHNKLAPQMAQLLLQVRAQPLYTLRQQNPLKSRTLLLFPHHTQPPLSACMYKCYQQ